MRALMFAGASLGLLAGVKYYALGYAAAAWLSLAAVWILHRGRRGGLLSVTLAFVMLLPSGYWYARNAWNTGTPLYPLGYSGPNLVEVESRLRGSVWESSLLGNGQIELLKRYVDAVWIDGGTCQTVAVLLLPFTILWLLSSGAHAVRPGPAGIETRVLRVGVVVATVSAWLIFAVTPFTVDPENGWLLRSSVLAVRFSLVPLTLSILALTLVLFDVQRWMENRRWRYPARQLSGLLAASFAVIALFGFCRAAVRHFDGEWMSLLISFDVALGLLFAGRLRLPAPVRQRTSLRAGFGLACGAGIAAATSLFLSQRWHDGFARHYDARFGTDAFSFLHGQEPPLPSIAALPFRYYPFFGSRRQFHVHRPLRVMSLRYLYKYIAANDIDLIAVVTRAGSHPETITSRRLLNWMKEQTGAFEKIMSGALFDVYRVDHGCLADGADAVSTGHIDRKRGDQLDSELNLRLHP